MANLVPIPTLRPFQQAAAELLRTEVKLGGDMRFRAPPGVGKSLAMLEAVRGIEGAAFVSAWPCMQKQIELLAKKMGVQIAFASLRDDLSKFSVIILSDELRESRVKHPKIVRL